MRKILIIGLLVIVGGAIGASFIAGREFNQQLHNLVVELEKDPRLEVVENTVNKSIFSSSGNMTVVMNLEDNQRLILENPWQASHLPGWVNYSGQTLVDLEVGDEAILNLLEELGMDTLEYEGTVGWKKATFSMAVEAFLFNDGIASIEIPNISLTSDYYYSGRQTGKLQAKQVTLIEKSYAATKLVFDDLILSWDIKGSSPWVEGDVELIANHVYFLSPQGEVELSKPSWSHQLVFNEQAFDYLMSLDLGKIKSQGNDLGIGKLTLKTEQFNGQAVANLIEVLTSSPSLEKTEEKDLQTVMDASDQLLSGSPAIVLEEFNLAVQTPFAFEQQATGKLSFDGSNLPLSYLLQLEEGSLDAEDPISRTRLELNFSKLDSGLLMMKGIPLHMLDPDADEQQLIFEAGELTLNGKLIPF